MGQGDGAIVEELPENIGGLMCRPVRYEDKVGIVEIDCYEGRDYMNAFFDDYFYERTLQCPMFCGDIEGTLVTFLGYLIMDDGTSAQIMGRRTRPGYEGRGYSNTLKDYALRILKRKYPRVTRFYSVAQQERYNGGYLKKRNWTSVLEMNTVLGSATDSDTITVTEQDANIVRLDDADAAEYIVNHCQRLHPENLFLIQYKVFQLTVSNLSALSPLYSYVRKPSSGQVTSLSFRTDYVARFGVTHDIDVRSDDYDELLAHIRAHLIELKRLDNPRGWKRAFYFHFSPVLFESVKNRIDDDIRRLFNIESELIPYPMRVIDESEQVNSLSLVSNLAALK